VTSFFIKRDILHARGYDILTCRAENPDQAFLIFQQDGGDHIERHIDLIGYGPLDKNELREDQ